jgi:predicted N-acyltransferase
VGVEERPQHRPDLPLSAPIRLRHLARIGEVDAASWDALFDPHYPFTRHAFLDALERNRCVGARTGWTPSHLVCEDDSGKLIGAVPLYLKAHSFGEFVFDFSWAQAATELGRRYYPKLLCAIPFTPATGPRLGARDASVRAALAERLRALPAQGGASSVHALFLGDEDVTALAATGLVERHDLQFHWNNAGYASFDDFAGALRADKRKKILRERRRVAESGIRFEARSGDELDEAQWLRVYALYANTYDERGQAPYLSFEFFLDYGRAHGTPLTLILGYEGAELVAVAITLRGGDTLYGRHWGAAVNYDSLHFETCYYQGIDLCIRQGLRRFDAGAQGEHKLARGFSPVVTRSAHWVADQRLHAAVDGALARERRWIESRRQELLLHSPYRSA